MSKAETKKSFPLEKILSTGLDDYFKYKNGKNYNSLFTYYEIVGVHVEGCRADFNIIGKVFEHDEIAESLASKVPLSAEVVVDYKFALSRIDRAIFYTASGTAVIPSNR